MPFRISSRFKKRVSKEEVLAAREVLKAVKTILEEDLQTSLKTMAKADNYELPAWSEKLADQLGYQRALREVVELISIKGNIND